MCLSYSQNAVTNLYFPRTMWESKPKAEFYLVKQHKTLFLPDENQTYYQKDIYMLRKVTRMHPKLLTVDTSEEKEGQGEGEGDYCGLHCIILFDVFSLKIYSLITFKRKKRH